MGATIGNVLCSVGAQYLRGLLANCKCCWIGVAVAVVVKLYVLGFIQASIECRKALELIRLSRALSAVDSIPPPKISLTA